MTMRKSAMHTWKTLAGGNPFGVSFIMSLLAPWRREKYRSFPIVIVDSTGEKSHYATAIIVACKKCRRKQNNFSRRDNIN